MNSTGRAFKDAMYEQLARIGKAIASPRRLELLDLLAQGPRTVEALARETGLSVANVSQHLQTLRAARLLLADKRGVFVRYRLAGDDVAAFYRALRILAESRLAEIEQVTRAFLGGRGVIEAVDGDDLARRMKRGAVTLLDVRPAEEFAAGHIQGARSIPLSQLERRLAELPRGRQVVAYCRGPYCVFAVEAVGILRRHGFRADRLADGVSDWRERGHRIAVGA
jgi:rhodanese-related sulfurtransferase/DNA-binding CsgD family transcriptional regulator